MTQIEAALNELMTFSIFSNLSRSEVIDFCRDGKIVTSSHKEKLFQFGEKAQYFGIVLSGAYKLSKPSMQGMDVIVHFSTPGDVIAAFIMAQTNPIYPVTTTSMGPSRFLKLPQSSYLNQWKKNSELIFKIQNLLSTRMNILQQDKVLLKAPLPQKVATLLMNLVEKHPSSDGLILPLPLTRKEIADAVGATPESVIRIMSEWSKQGYLQTNDQNIEILRPDKIIELVEKN